MAKHKKSPKKPRRSPLTDVVAAMAVHHKIGGLRAAPPEAEALAPVRDPTQAHAYLSDDADDNAPVILALVPPDLGRCQCEWADQRVPTFGPKPVVRCHTTPTVVAFQKRVPDHLPEPTGAMSLCDEHRLMLEAFFPGQLYYRLITSDRKLGDLL